MNSFPETRFVLQNTEGADEAYRLIAEADPKLPARVRTSLRWRILYLRALIDSELVKHQFRVSRKCLSAFQELTTICHAQKAKPAVRPPPNAAGVVE